MRWGKFAGYRVDELPTSYAVWVLENAQRLEPDLRDALRDELAARLGIEADHGQHDWSPPRCDRPHLPTLPPEPIRSEAAEIIRAGYRLRAKAQHPDTGGDHAAMLAVGDAKLFLDRIVGGAA